jgi:hypothetical protein
VTSGREFGYPSSISPWVELKPHDGFWPIVACPLLLHFPQFEHQANRGSTRRRGGHTGGRYSGVSDGVASPLPLAPSIRSGGRCRTTGQTEVRFCRHVLPPSFPPAFMVTPRISIRHTGNCMQPNNGIVGPCYGRGDARVGNWNQPDYEGRDTGRSHGKPLPQGKLCRDGPGPSWPGCTARRVADRVVPSRQTKPGATT